MSWESVLRRLIRSAGARLASGTGTLLIELLIAMMVLLVAVGGLMTTYASSAL